MRTTVTVAASLACLSFATPAVADTYAVSNGVKGVIDMYDLSSMKRTAKGFSIWNVAVSDHFPKIFGSVAYRVSREDYDCQTGKYDIAVLQEYDKDGKQLNKIESADTGAMEVVAATSSSEVYNRFCDTQRGVKVAGLPSTEQVEQATIKDAYLYGRKLLDAAK